MPFAFGTLLAFPQNAFLESHRLRLRGCVSWRVILICGICFFLPAADAGGNRLLGGGLLAFATLRRGLDSAGGFQGLNPLGQFVTPSPNLDPDLVRESSCPNWGWKGFSDEEATQCRADRGLASAG